MNKQAAGLFGLSEITVTIHRGNATRKMEARSLAELMRRAEALSLPWPKYECDKPLYGVLAADAAA